MWSDFEVNIAEPIYDFLKNLFLSHSMKFNYKANRINPYLKFLFFFLSKSHQKLPK